MIRPLNAHRIHHIHLSFCLGAAMMRTKFTVERCATCGMPKENHPYQKGRQACYSRPPHVWNILQLNIWGIKHLVADLSACSWTKTPPTHLVTLDKMNELHSARIHRIHTKVTCPDCWVIFDEMIQLWKEPREKVRDIETLAQWEALESP